MTALSTKEAWDVRQILLDASRYIGMVCAIAERDTPQSHEVSQRLSDFAYNSIQCSLDELAAEIQALAMFITSNEWELTEHTCGYSVAAGDVPPEVCYHQSCWEESDFIAIAAEMQAKARSMVQSFITDEEES